MEVRDPGSPRDLVASSVDPEEALDRLLRDLRSSRNGLSDREAARRLVSVVQNVLVRRRGGGWALQLVRQLVHQRWRPAPTALRWRRSVTAPTGADDARPG